MINIYDMVKSKTNQNVNWPTWITSTKHYKTMDFSCLCALEINILLSRLNLILDLIRMSHRPTLLSSQFDMCREFLRLLVEFGPSRHWRGQRWAVPNYSTELLFPSPYRRNFLKYVPVPNYSDFATSVLFSDTFLFSTRLVFFFCCWRE